MSHNVLFSSKTYIQRRQQLSTKVAQGLILIMGNGESPMNYTDNVYHFRQDSNFLYFLGIDQPGLAALIDPEEGHTTLYGDDITVDHIVWTGPQPTMRELADRVGVAHMAPFARLAEDLQAARSQERSIHFLPPYRDANRIYLSQYLGIDLGDLSQRASQSLVKAVIDLRAYKSEEEIVEMEKALTTSVEMHLTSMRMARPGMLEAELTGAVHGVAVSAGGNLAYPIILTVNGQTLHNHHHHNVLQEGQMVLGDFGAETPMHYAGDITRTFPVAQQFSTQQKEIYQIVLDAELGAIGALQPGRTYREVHLLAAQIIASGLKDLGLMQGDPKAAVAAGAHALFFPHGLGHMIGLDVHDMEDLGEDLVGYNEQVQRSSQFGLRSLRLGRALEPGFVLTVEPGIYFIPELIDQWQATGKFTEYINYEKVQNYRNFSGIRIEDNYLITDDGARLLGPELAKTIEEVEAVRASG